MEIGIIGTGSVGSALARGFAAADHDVVLGSRTPTTASLDGHGWGEGVEVLGQREAAECGDVVVLALPADAVVEAAADLSAALAGKPVVDPTNEYPAATADRSLAERVAAAAPDATVVKAFNTVGAEHLSDPVVAGEPVTMFVAGEPPARETVDELAADLGFEVIAAGDLSAAGRLEDLARLWIDLSREHGRDVAFRLLRG
jgi:hypothetical protein